jgi:hypothetical protein
MDEAKQGPHAMKAIAIVSGGMDSVTLAHILGGVVPIWNGCAIRQRGTGQQRRYAGQVNQRPLRPQKIEQKLHVLGILYLQRKLILNTFSYYSTLYVKPRLAS